MLLCYKQLSWPKPCVLVLGFIHGTWAVSQEIKFELKAQRGERINPAAFPALDPTPPSQISDTEQQIYPREVNV